VNRLLAVSFTPIAVRCGAARCLAYRKRNVDVYDTDPTYLLRRVAAKMTRDAAPHRIQSQRTFSLVL